VHVCYIATVSRFVFAYDAYVGGFGLAGVARPLIRRLAAWDLRAAARPTAYVANSHNVARRIARYYGRSAYVLHPAVDVDRFHPGDGSGGYFLVVSRLLHYKRIDIAIDACAAVDAPLTIVGSGPALAALKARAAGTRTSFVGALPDDRLDAVMGGARAVILPGEEDFGLVPVEAAAAGRPTIAYGAGGALESIVPGVTGEHFPAQGAAALAEVLRAFEPQRYDPVALRAHAETFAPARFRASLRAIVEGVQAGKRP
jgi:glycosyltransferase involved in cell wall biosynthesis